MQWNDLKENLGSSFGNLREDKDFTDLTLACQDGKQVEAHKSILCGRIEETKAPKSTDVRGLMSENLLAMIDSLSKSFFR